MTTHRLIGIALLGLASLTSCSSNNNFLYQSQVNQNLAKESWMRQVNVDPNKWAKNADSWFFTGEPNQTERNANTASYSNAMTIAAVKVPQFTNINVKGSLQVQLVGLQNQNSVYVLGTNAAVGQTSVKVRGDTVYISQNKDGDASSASLSNVIVRIGVHNLRNLAVSGSSKVEARNLMSDGLSVSSNSSGMVLLNGNMNLARVTQTGSGTVSVMGAYSPNLNLSVNGMGNLNVSGKVNIHNIHHAGSGSVNVIGLDSAALNIDTSGNGLTSVAGYGNLKKLTAQDGSRVYFYWVNSNGAYISAQGKATIGLAGAATNLNIDLAGSSRLEGQYLHGTNVYVRTRGAAHANIAADKKIFAAASDYSSIYFYGSPNSVSRFMDGSGSVLPMWSDSTSFPAQQMQPVEKAGSFSPWVKPRTYKH